MTIGSIEQSIHAKEGEENHDFKTLLATRDALQEVLRARFADKVGFPSPMYFFLCYSSFSSFPPVSFPRDLFFSHHALYLSSYPGDQND